jgi:hypothetical protein
MTVDSEGMRYRVYRRDLASQVDAPTDYAYFLEEDAIDECQELNRLASYFTDQVSYIFIYKEIS